MPPDGLPSTSGSSPESPGEEGVGAYIRERAWACTLVLLAYALLFTPIFFAIVGLFAGSFTVAVLVAPILGLAGAGGMLRYHGFLEAFDRARRGAPLWVRLLAPVPVFVFVFALAFVLLGSLQPGFTLLLLGALGIGLAGASAFAWGFGLWRDVSERTRGAPLWVRLLLAVPVFLVTAALGFVVLGGVLQDFRLLMLAITALGALVTGLVVALTGLWSDVSRRVRDSSSAQRLVVLTLVGVMVGLLGFLTVLLVLEEMALALAALLPSALLGATAAAYLSGWIDDVRRTVRGWHYGIRVGAFVLLEVLLTLYIALLVGPFLPNALLGYGVGVLGGLLLLVPASIWAHTWRDLWGAFVDAGEDRRFLATLPVLPLGIGLVFLVLVVTTSMFDLAYVVSVPAGVALFLLAGLPFGVTQDLPRMTRARDLPARTAIFAGVFLLTGLYAYFAIALFVQIVEVALIGGIVFAGLVLAALIYRFDLGEGMVEEFEEYGALGEAAILGAVFVLALGVTFLVIALALGDFRIAFLVSVLVAAGVNYVVAHATGLVEGAREALARLPWWAELLALSGMFVLAFVFGTVAIGSFVPIPGLAMLVGALFALAAVVALSRDLEVGEEIMDTADERKRARTPILVLAFLGGFLVGLYLAAAAFQAVGVSLFGLPFFVALLAGAGTVIALSRRRDWDENVLARVRTGTDKAKTGGILLAWLFVGVLTGFALQAVPIEGPVLGIGDASGLPLALTLAAGLFLWAWLPVVLFRLARVERTPVDATRSAPEKQRTLASLGWGLLIAAVTLVVLLTVLDRTVLSVGVAVALGYLTALLMGARGGREPEEG